MTESITILRPVYNEEKIDFEDLLQLGYAIKNGCDVFITQDKGIHKTYYGIDVVGLNDV